MYKYRKIKKVDSITEDLYLFLDINIKRYIEYESFLSYSIDKSKLFTKENCNIDW